LWRRKPDTTVGLNIDGQINRSVAVTETSSLEQHRAALARGEIDRRAALKLAFGAGIAAVAPIGDARALPSAPQFVHGVASGDPTPQAVVLWTRVTPSEPKDIGVLWRIADNPAFHNARSGVATARAQSDWTVKIDIRNLRHGTDYWYQFVVPAATPVASPVGHTRTAALGEIKNLKLAVLSCSIFDKGFFNVYADLAERRDIDAVLHLGDYIYEYGRGGYKTPALALGLVNEPRSAEVEPPTELLMLEEYRTRYGAYRSDENLQEAHRRFPWITVWDDHEIANDAWTGGAENHQANEGSWAARKAAAIRAYYEWMPIREPADGARIDPATGNPSAMYRSFDFGNLARLIMLDTRHAGRQQQLTTPQLLAVYQGATATGAFPLDVDATGHPRMLLGAEQEAWFDERVASSRQVWQLVGNQVLLFFQQAADYLNLPVLTAQEKAGVATLLDQLFGPGAGQLFATLGAAGGPNPATADSWNGYPSARNRFYASLAKARNPVILSGDSHNGWVAELRAPGPNGTVRPLGVEFGGTSVTSPGYEETFPTIGPAKLSDLFVASSAAHGRTDRLVYNDASRRGYLLLNVNPERVKAEFVFVDTVFSPRFTTEVVDFHVKAGQKTVRGGAPAT
jgi:alkaline phosphatase D